MQRAFLCVLGALGLVLCSSCSSLTAPSSEDPQQLPQLPERAAPAGSGALKMRPMPMGSGVVKDTAGQAPLQRLQVGQPATP